MHVSSNLHIPSGDESWRWLLHFDGEPRTTLITITKIIVVKTKRRRQLLVSETFHGVKLSRKINTIADRHTILICTLSVRTYTNCWWKQNHCTWVGSMLVAGGNRGYFWVHRHNKNSEWPQTFYSVFKTFWISNLLLSKKS